MKYLNRELSWLSFNSRVLEEAEDRSVPLLERLNYMSIFSSNLDEFFMVRVGGLCDQRLVNPSSTENKTNMTPAEQLSAIYKKTRKLLHHADSAYSTLLSDLKKADINILKPSDLDSEDSSYLLNYFKRELFPLLSPQIVDKNHPFPFLKNNTAYIGLGLLHKENHLVFGLIPLNENFSQYIRLPGKSFKICLTSDVLLFFADKVFKKHNITDRFIFKITRNADLDTSEAMLDEETDFREHMQELLRRRKKLSPVRLMLSNNISAELKKYLLKKLSLASVQIFTSSLPFSFGFVSELPLENHPELFFPPLVQNNNVFKKGISAIEQVMRKDFLFSYPFDSMNDFIRLLNEAATDPFVLSIKITLYRVAKNSKIIDALIHAAEYGKDVCAVVELRARFDEQNNIDWAQQLEDAGVTLFYGHESFKTHSKLLLITRKTPSGISYITQIGTGNYNEKTARQYTDLSLITSNSEIGMDATEFFLALSLGETPTDCTHLLVAPLLFRSRIIEMFDEQIELAHSGMPAAVTAKINAITDKQIIDKISEAAEAGVKIDLIVRGICCFTPSSENLRVISIVGRFLEHSRIYAFGPNREKIYISSGDWMTRSTTRRIEVAAPIFDDEIKQRISSMLDIMLKDTVKARIMQSNGAYKKQRSSIKLNSQEYFLANSRLLPAVTMYDKIK